MKQYEIKIYTDIDMGTEKFVRFLLENWLNHPNKSLRPDRYDKCEPARRKFDDQGVQPVVDIWLKTGMTPVLKRVARPKFDCSFEWYRAINIKKGNAIPWSITIWIDSDISRVTVLEFLTFLVFTFKPAFGSVALDEEMEANHKITYSAYGGIAEKYVGLEVGPTWPGIYWMTYFGPWSLRKIGAERMERLSLGEKIPIDSGILVEAYQDAFDWNLAQSRSRVSQIKYFLGDQNFFSKARI